MLGSLWAGVCDYDHFWSLAGRVAQSAEAMPNFSFCYVTSRKNQLFCAPILYRYIIIKFYNNATIFSRLLPICVCFRGSAPDPAKGAPDPAKGANSTPITPGWERLCFGKKCHLFFFPPMTCLWITSRTTCRRENCQGGRARPSSKEASHEKHRPYIKVHKKKKKKAALESVPLTWRPGPAPHYGGVLPPLSCSLPRTPCRSTVSPAAPCRTHSRSPVDRLSSSRGTRQRNAPTALQCHPQKRRAYWKWEFMSTYSVRILNSYT